MWGLVWDASRPVFTSEVVQGRAAHCVELESPGCLCCLVRPSHWENITITKYLERRLMKYWKWTEHGYIQDDRVVNTDYNITYQDQLSYLDSPLWARWSAVDQQTGSIPVVSNQWRFDTRHHERTGTTIYHVQLHGASHCWSWNWSQIFLVL